MKRGMHRVDSSSCMKSCRAASLLLTLMILLWGAAQARAARGLEWRGNLALCPKPKVKTEAQVLEVGP